MTHKRFNPLKIDIDKVYINLVKEKVILFRDKAKTDSFAVMSLTDFTQAIIEGEFVMAKIGDIVKDEKVFEDAEQVKCSAIIGKDIVIEAVCKRIGETGDYLIVQAQCEGKKISFSCGGRVVVEKLNKVATSFEQAITDQILVLKEIVEARIVEVKSNEGRVYYDLE